MQWRSAGVPASSTRTAELGPQLCYAPVQDSRIARALRTRFARAGGSYGLPTPAERRCKAWGASLGLVASAWLRCGGHLPTTGLPGAHDSSPLEADGRQRIAAHPLGDIPRCVCMHLNWGEAMTKAQRILKLYNGKRTTREIAEIVGCNQAYVRVVARQRRGGSYSEIDLRYLQSPLGQKMRAETQARWRKANPEKIREMQRNYKRRRYHSDPEYRKRCLDWISRYRMAKRRAEARAS